MFVLFYALIICPRSKTARIDFSEKMRFKIKNKLINHNNNAAKIKY